MGVSKNRGGPPKWMVKIMETPIKMEDLGAHPYFWKHPYQWNAHPKGNLSQVASLCQNRVMQHPQHIIAERGIHGCFRTPTSAREHPAFLPGTTDFIRYRRQRQGLWSLESNHEAHWTYGLANRTCMGHELATSNLCSWIWATSGYLATLPTIRKVQNYHLNEFVISFLKIGYSTALYSIISYNILPMFIYIGAMCVYVYT